MAKWVNGERPKPPINVEPTMRDIKDLGADWYLMGYTREQVAAAMAELSAECLRHANELDREPYDAALADVRRTVRRALAGKTAEAR